VVDPIIEMQEAITVKAAGKLTAAAGLAPLKVLYEGEPAIVPVKLYPFGVLFIESSREATGEDGYGGLTGMRYYRFDGYLSIEVLHRDAPMMVPGPDRTVAIPSYNEVKGLISQAHDVFIAWGGAGHERILEDPATSIDDRAETVELFIDTIRYGLNRRENNVSNTASFEFHIYVRVLDFP